MGSNSVRGAAAPRHRRHGPGGPRRAQRPRPPARPTRPRLRAVEMAGSVSMTMTWVRGELSARSRAASSSAMLPTFVASAPRLRACRAKSMSWAAAWGTSARRLLKGRSPTACCRRLMQPKPRLSRTTISSLSAHHHGGGDLGIHHEIAAVAHQHDDPPVGKGELHPEPAGDLIAHAGIAVFQVIALGRAGAPELVQLARQAARRGHHDVALAGLAVDGAQHLGIGGQGIAFRRRW